MKRSPSGDFELEVVGIDADLLDVSSVIRNIPKPQTHDPIAAGLVAIGILLLALAGGLTILRAFQPQSSQQSTPIQQRSFDNGNSFQNHGQINPAKSIGLSNEKRDRSHRRTSNQSRYISGRNA